MQISQIVLEVMVCGHVTLLSLISSCFFLLGFDLNAFMLDIKAQAVIDAHVLVGNPHQSKKGDEVATPVRIEQLVASDDEEKDSDVMAETVLAGKNIENLRRKKLRDS